MVDEARMLHKLRYPIAKDHFFEGQLMTNGERKLVVGGNYFGERNFWGRQEKH